MYSNLFQTKQRRLLQEGYGHTTKDITLCGKKYFCLWKQKKLGPFSYYRGQILGVDISMDDIPTLKKELQHRCTQQSPVPVFIQIGFTSLLHISQDPRHISKEQTRDILQQRQDLHKERKKHKLIPSFKENMPASTFVLSTTQDEEELLQNMNSHARRHLRKAWKQKLSLTHLQTKKEKETFYTHRKKLANTKGFSIISKSQFTALTHLFQKENCGTIVEIRKDEKVLAGGIYLRDEETVRYVYGFSTREKPYINMGAHYLLQFEMRKYAKTHGYRQFDFFGGAPTGVADHHLAGVERFKSSFGTTKIDVRGNADIVCNPWWYYPSKRYYQRRK